MRRWIVVALLILSTVAGLSLAVELDSEPVPDEATTPVATPPVEHASPGPDATASEPSGGEPATAGPAGSLVIWARGDLSPGFADAVAILPRVTAVAHVRSSTLGLVGTRASDGSAVEVLRDGYRIPVAVAAVDPVAYAETIAADVDRDTVSSLGPGQAVLSETAARLRGVGVGGEIDLLSLPGLEVVGIVEDESIGRSEIVLHESDATAAGLDEDGTVFLRHDAKPGAETQALMMSIEGLVPPDVIARIVDVTAGEPRRRAPLVLSLAQVKQRFGEFAFRPLPGAREIEIESSFPDEQIVTVEVPILGPVTCHEKIIHDLRGALEQVVEKGLGAEIDPSRYAGCYHPRRITTTGDRLSRHSWGIALDINVDLSLPDLGPAPHPDVVAAFERHGFRWGGDFLRPDNHHFEWIGAEAVAARGGP